ncbi:hypothetical protein IAD21_03306 [Abditibacteriota bacterium]|nr:hypothetical protein IAD21_03306 [Abditibacteriota bacterium]
MRHLFSLPTFSSHLGHRLVRRIAVLTGLGTLVVAIAVTVKSQPRPAAFLGVTSPSQLVTGKRITPAGTQTPIGSFPANMVVSPDGRFVLVTNAGMREYLSVLRSSDGSLVSRLDWNGVSPVFKNKKRALYFGMVCGAIQNGQTPVYVSRGAEGTVSVLSLSAEGQLTDTGKKLGVESSGKDDTVHLAGLAISADGTQLFAANNSAAPKNAMRGELQILNTQNGVVQSQVSLPGYPFAVAATRSGKVYVSSEQRGTISVINATTGKVLSEISTGTQPVGVLLDKAQKCLFVTNAGSDTLSIIDTATDRVTGTLLLRPSNARGLAGATPLGLTLSPDEKRLYIALADLNAVAVVELPSVRLAGFFPVGWYPTSAVTSPDGTHLFVANAKGVQATNPNGKPVAGLTSRPQYIQNIIEGTVSTLDLTKAPDLKASTALVLQNNRGPVASAPKFRNPGIKHVFYIIKENRTYDQVLGDIPQGNGDPSLVLFGREVTPNLHALAERFALLDNFYCCAEVSGDGWNWSTGGMISEYTARNVPHNYGGRQRPYDFEGTNNGVAVDRLDIPDAARPPGGYIWDLCAAHKVSLRNYGFFTDDLDLPRTLAEEGTEGKENSPTKRALIGKCDSNFRQFDLTYADSEAWKVANLTPAPKQTKTYGANSDPARISAWKREFANYVKNGNLPSFSMVRLGRDHTSGTTAGASSPRAMVADNDYAVGQLVETISHSAYWKSSAIVIVEDDAQNGYDHVDAHRSTAYVISPFIERGTHYNRFGNTDSALKTIELLLGLPPMTAYDAGAAPLAVFGSRISNAEPYTAMLPAHDILAEVNTPDAPQARESALILNPFREESGPDEKLNEILWHSIKGKAPVPQRHYTLFTPTKEKDDDDD